MSVTPPVELLTMSEPADKLRSTLTELESELRELEHFDPHTRTILEQAVVDIK